MKQSRRNDIDGWWVGVMFAVAGAMGACSARGGTLDASWEVAEESVDERAPIDTAPLRDASGADAVTHPGDRTVPSPWDAALEVSSIDATPDATTDATVVSDRLPACPSGMSLCAGRCVDVSRDPQHCGGCESPCAAGASCRAGRCESPRPPRWTVFVYGHADHNLSPSLLADLEEMASASLRDTVQLVVMSDWDGDGELPADGSSSEALRRWNTYMPLGTLGPGNTWPTGTLWLRVPGDRQRIELLRREVERNLDDPSVLANAVSEVITQFPADRYGVILWDHGGGWLGGFGGDMHDGTVSHSVGMTAEAVAQALRQGARRAGLGTTRPFEFVAFDTCLMAGAEVIHSFRDVAQVYLAEAEIDFGNGWDYVPTLTWLASNSAAPVRDFAREELRTWSLHHRGASQSDALFRSKIAFDLTQLDAFEGAVRSMADALLGGGTMHTEALARAFYTARPTYGVRESGDNMGNYRHLRDLGQILRTLEASPSAAPTLRNAARGASEALARAIVANDAGLWRGMYGQVGLHVYAPPGGVYDSASEMLYRTLASGWATASRWTEVLAAMRPGSAPWPTITRTLYNGTYPTGDRLPRIEFSASGAVVEAEVRVARRDISFAGPGRRWFSYGPLLHGLIDPGRSYTATWSGRVTALHVGTAPQPVTVEWYLKAFDPMTRSVVGMLAIPGLCRLGSREVSECELVFRADTLALDTVVRWSGTGERRQAHARSFAEFVRLYPTAHFTPRIRIENDDSQLIGWLNGVGYPLATSSLRVTMAPAMTGYYALQTLVTDVYGRSSRTTDYVDVQTPPGLVTTALLCPARRDKDKDFVGGVPARGLCGDSARGRRAGAFV